VITGGDFARIGMTQSSATTSYVYDGANIVQEPVSGNADRKSAQRWHRRSFYAHRFHLDSEFLGGRR
jgi:hypothetical protein